MPCCEGGFETCGETPCRGGGRKGFAAFLIFFFFFKCLLIKSPLVAERQQFPSGATALPADLRETALAVPGWLSALLPPHRPAASPLGHVCPRLPLGTGTGTTLGPCGYFILFYFVLFYFILFCFILFYSILFYYILFYYILFYFILFYFILFYFILFYFILLYFILLYFILLYFILLYLFLLLSFALEEKWSSALPSKPSIPVGTTSGVSFAGSSGISAFRRLFSASSVTEGRTCCHPFFSSSPPSFPPRHGAPTFPNAGGHGQAPAWRKRPNPAHNRPFPAGEVSLGKHKWDFFNLFPGSPRESSACSLWRRARGDAGGLLRVSRSQTGARGAPRASFWARDIFPSQTGPRAPPARGFLRSRERWSSALHLA